ncbi:polysaccharide deacetylase family protein [Flavobacterium sp. J49]|uniref:polysaccharide deacetylase family protein n=1 Tax=Flavobacterium sp. J49 TaxID=2718534 RepID=UPI00159399AB|nr:polysaccharide deacetylase family protein [Flavobacterium sp. J49]MBF6640018.1 polysaccharide deacetylase family protein [Flavobacterium sp. J49]NIC01263.1 polysaccharide deacetylase family protein [Flavobacterium sp. J49]
MKNLRVLTYHEVDNPANFGQQLRWLKKNYTIIGIDALEELQRQNSDLSGCVLITFDDGERTVFEQGLPILKTLSIPATVFIVTDYIGTKKPFWWQKVNYYFKGQPIQERQNFTKQYKNATVEQRETLMNRLEHESHLPIFEYNQLTLAELKQMHDNGVTIANHTVNHHFLNELGYEAQCKEMTEARDFLNQHGFYGDYLAYPNGFYNELTAKALKDSKIKYSFLFDHKINKEAKDFNISRLSVNSNTALWKFKFILSGWHSKILKFRLLLKR